LAQIEKVEALLVGGCVTEAALEVVAALRAAQGLLGDGLHEDEQELEAGAGEGAAQDVQVELQCVLEFRDHGEHGVAVALEQGHGDVGGAPALPEAHLDAAAQGALQDHRLRPEDAALKVVGQGRRQ